MSPADMNTQASPIGQARIVEGGRWHPGTPPTGNQAPGFAASLDTFLQKNRGAYFSNTFALNAQ